VTSIIAVDDYIVNVDAQGDLVGSDVPVKHADIIGVRFEPDCGQEH
jgi:hypothetical protein